MGRALLAPRNALLSAAPTGPALYAGGDFSSPDSHDSYLAKWGCLDTNPPTISCPKSIVVDDRPDSRGEILTFTVTALDEEDPTPSVVCVPPSGSLFPRGTTIVTPTPGSVAPPPDHRRNMPSQRNGAPVPAYTRSLLPEEPPMISRPAALVPFVLAIAGRPVVAQYAEPDAYVLLQKSFGTLEAFGSDVLPLEDVSGDGVLDFATSARGASPFPLGTVYAFSGADCSLLWSRSDGVATLGSSLAAIDWNGDGVLDVVAGAPYGGIFGYRGEVWIYSGLDGAPLATILGGGTGHFGWTLATGGDLDGDGGEDLLVSEPFYDLYGGEETGRVYAYARGSTVPFMMLDGTHFTTQYMGVGLSYVGDTSSPPDGGDEFVVSRQCCFTSAGEGLVYGWDGTQPVLRFQVALSLPTLGINVDGRADLNGDGTPDFAVGDTQSNRVWLFSGRDGAMLYTLDGQGEQGAFGAVHLIGDVNGDARPDVAVGAIRNSTGAPDGGKVFVYSGVSGTLLKTITSLTAGQFFGSDVRELGDLNGDGKIDLIVGAPGYPGLNPPGEVVVLSAHLPAPKNTFHSAALATDPMLVDSGGDPTAGPIIGSPIEVFNLSLDCSGAPFAGLYVMQARVGLLPTPLPLPWGHLWIGGSLLCQCRGVHAQSVVVCAPGGVVLPNDPALIGFTYAVQGFCGGRFSNALGQTVGG